MQAQCLDFVIVGPPRSGTTWMDSALRLHGGVALPSGEKETFFLDRFQSKGWEWYWSTFFRHADRAKMFGEVSPTYFHRDDVRNFLVKTHPCCKIVICYRDPVKRAMSHYRHYQKYGLIRPDADWRMALEKYPEILQGSAYREHFDAWQAAFGASQVKLIRYADLVSDPTGFVADLYDFLGLEHQNSSPNLLSLVDSRNESSVPRHPFVARVAKFVAELMRAAGFYWALEWARKMNLKQLFFSGGDEQNLFLPDLDWLASRLADQRLEVSDV